MLEQELPEIQFSGTQNQPKNELKTSFKILTHFNKKKKEKLSNIGKIVDILLHLTSTHSPQFP